MNCEDDDCVSNRLPVPLTVDLINEIDAAKRNLDFMERARFFIDRDKSILDALAD
jgi:hypothetical protein